jgi:uncharacterized RDD family membrane protein YckC
MATGPSFGRRVAAIGVDFAILAAALFAVIGGAAALAPLGQAPFAAIWPAPAPVEVISEPVGAPRTEKIEGGITRTQANRREIRFFADGSVRIYGVLDTAIRYADGTARAGTTEVLVGENQGAIRRRWATTALAILLPVAYFALFESSRLQASPGKLVFGLRVTDLAGGRLSLSRALARQALKLLDLASSMITFLIAAFTRRGQALHDMLAGTLVVRRPG